MFSGWLTNSDKSTIHELSCLRDIGNVFCIYLRIGNIGILSDTYYEFVILHKRVNFELNCIGGFH